MTDFEKERELSKEGMEMKENNDVEELKENGSSLAADQESVTDKNILNTTKNDSSKIVDDSSSGNNNREKKNDETSQGKIVSSSSDVKEESDNPNQLSPNSDKEKKLPPEPIPPSNNSESNVPEEEKTSDAESELEDKENSSDAQEKPSDIKKDISDNKKDLADQTKNDDENVDDISKNSADKANEAEKTPSDTSDQSKEKIEDSKSEDFEEEHTEEEEVDYSVLEKDELINEFEKILKIDDLKLVEKKIRDLRPFFDEIVNKERKNALQNFLDEGGTEIDFQYVGDALDARFFNLNEKYKARRNNYYAELERSKEDNLIKKQEILEKLRSIVDGEETNASISALKNIQKEWRSVGPVPSSTAKSLWATYNILIDRFYDNRSIYFELKELDRKKNLEAKLELCEKAEHLLDYDVIRDAVKELNELHEEFKHIGPVPKEMQDVVWQRFKSASDAIYNRRKDYVSGLKKELHENLDLKKHLVDEVAAFDDFNSDKISDWNEKTKEILEIQKKWEAIGGLPREHAKEVNKHFWSSFKTFFNNKNKFFKKLESQRDENLIKKEDLVKRAEELKESTEWDKTADKLKELQQEWKDIGPVPEKNRNEVYKRFKNACDTFFNRKREHSKEVESEYKVNLKKKDEICAEIEKMVEDNNKDIDRFKELQIHYNSIGFVPRNTIKKIQKKYSRVTELFLSSFDLTETKKSELRFAAEVDKLKSDPNADRKIHRKEVELRRLISKVENDIALWKNNIEFFAQSKTADKVRKEFNDKIDKATAQLKELREELKVLNKI